MENHDVMLRSILLYSVVFYTLSPLFDISTYSEKCLYAFYRIVSYYVGQSVQSVLFNAFQCVSK